MGWAYLQILPLADLSLAEKKTPPPGAFREFFEYYSDYQSYINKTTEF